MDDRRIQAIESVTSAIWSSGDQHEINAGVKSIVAGCADAVKGESEELLEDLEKRINRR